MAGESKLKTDCCDYAVADGWLYIHVMQTEKRGRPDSVFIRRGIHKWVEFKNIGKKARPQQKLRHVEMRAVGAEVAVIDNFENFVAFLNA